MRRLTTSDFLAEVRSLLDENNKNSVTDDDILSALNRAQDTCVNTLATQYSDPLLTFLLATSTTSVPLPDCLEDRVENVEVEIPEANGKFRPLQRIDFREISRVDTAPLLAGAAYPSYYYVQGREVFILPEASSPQNLKIWYLKDPAPLGYVQGMISAIAADYIMVSQLGTELSEDFSDLRNFVSIIKGSTGEVRASFQILKIENEQKISFRPVPLRNSVFGLPISPAASLATCGAELDDYVVIHAQTCIPFLKKPVANAIIYLALADLKGTKLNQDVTLDTQKAMSFLQKVERTWVGRESTYRIKSKSNSFRRRSYPRER